MRSLILTAAVVAASALLMLPTTAGAGPGGKPAVHDHGTFADVDPDFCGTGASINVAGRFNFKAWIGETGGDPEQELKTAFNYSVTATNPETGASVGRLRGWFLDERNRGRPAVRRSHASFR